MYPQYLKMPNENEMLTRLKRADGDPYVNERLFPLLLKVAGKELSPAGVVAAFWDAIEEYCEKKPPSTLNVMLPMLLFYIDRVIDDKKFVEKARVDFMRILSEVSKKK